MKKILSTLLFVLLLTGCGYAVESPAEELEEKLSRTIENPTETTEEQDGTAVQTASSQGYFPDFNSITDEQVIQLVLSDTSNTERISDFYVPEIKNDYRIVFVPEGEELEDWCADKIHFSPERAQNYVIDNIEMIADEELYVAYRITYTENIQMLTEVQLFPKYFRMSGNGYAYYIGELDEASVLSNFDLIAKDQKIIYRRFRDDPEMKCIAYDFYAVTRMDDATAELGWYCYLIDRNDKLVSTIPEWNQKRTISIPDDTSQKQTENVLTSTSLSYDIQLRVNQTEILIGQDESEIIWYAEIPVDCDPEIVYLVDADTEEIVAELRDEADFEKYGDTIKGDAVYNCRFTVDTDIDTDPNRSEERYYHYYAEFIENNVIHRSETAEIWVLEPFTEKELDDMEAVDQAISELMQSGDYKNLDDAEKLNKVAALLEVLASQGTANRPYSLIMSDSIWVGDDTISFQYTCGVGGGIKITPFDERMN